jgi:CBS domain-containing protein
MKVREIMTAEVVTVQRETSVNRVAQLMDQRGVSGVPVADESGRVVGIITELDLIVRNTRLEPPAFFQILDGRIPLETPGHFRKRMQHMLGTEARDVMSAPVVSIGPDAEVEELAELMSKRRVNPVPVIAGDRLLGIVSRADIVRMMAHDIGNAD